MVVQHFEHTCQKPAQTEIKQAKLASEWRKLPKSKRSLVRDARCRHQTGGRALRELNVALCRGNASLCRSDAFVATRASARNRCTVWPSPRPRWLKPVLSPVRGFWIWLPVCVT
jgi:hypothetical protein